MVRLVSPHDDHDDAQLQHHSFSAKVEGNCSSKGSDHYCCVALCFLAWIILNELCIILVTLRSSVLQELSGRTVVQLRRQQRGLGAWGRSVHQGRLHPLLSEARRHTAVVGPLLCPRYAVARFPQCCEAKMHPIYFLSTVNTFLERDRAEECCEKWTRNIFFIHFLWNCCNITSVKGCTHRRMFTPQLWSEINSDIFSKLSIQNFTLISDHYINKKYQYAHG